MFADVKVKDYTVLIDGKPHTITKERWLGVIGRKDGLTTDEENYFEGSVFDYDEKTDSYQMGGSVSKSKAELEAEAKSICYFK
jgi:hypothetical protein